MHLQTSHDQLDIDLSHFGVLDSNRLPELASPDIFPDHEPYIDAHTEPPKPLAADAATNRLQILDTADRFFQQRRRANTAQRITLMRLLHDIPGPKLPAQRQSPHRKKHS